MNSKNAEYYLNLKIYPNKSLTLFTLIVFVSIFLIASLFASYYFIDIGAWPVAIFFLIDFILVLYALGVYKKRSNTYDRIILKKKLLIISVSNNGRKRQKIIEPTWLRLKIYSDRKDRYLSIISKGNSVKVGKFLNIKELDELAKIIKKALIEREKQLTFTC
ncbi:MAG: DUF2244 domain-containing protein [Pseudomonadota bacterium]|nr:DUF2244 domain-containing protein [Pseudomonadota bacterium]